MSDVGLSEASGVNHEATSSGEITAGTMMRIAREASGLHVAALAVAMKIPVKKLEALEADRLDLLHDAVFVRALAASVCRALKIDPAPVLGKLPLNAAPKLNSVERGINAPFHSHNDAVRLGVPALLRKPTALMVLALIVSAIAVFFMPDVKLTDWSGESANQANKSTDSSAAAQVMPPASELPEPEPTPIAAVSAVVPDTVQRVPKQSSDSEVLPSVAVAGIATPTQNVSTPIAQGAVASQSIASASLPTAASSRPFASASVPAVAATRPASAVALPSTGTVVFKAKGTSWVKVVDAKGIVQLSKTIVNGEVVGASGTEPLSVVVGRVDVTDVEVRGKPFVLTGVSKENVARFEVK